MKPFLMLVGVAAVAGAMYVAGASGSQQTKFAPESQVVALQKKVKTLTTEVNKTVGPEAKAALGIISSCYLQVMNNQVKLNLFPVNVLGNSSDGYLFGTDASSATPTSALDYDNVAPSAYLQYDDPNCLSAAARHRSLGTSSSALLRLAGRTH
jgi:hypothetical protein